MTAVQPDRQPRAASPPLAPISWGDVDGRTFAELTDERYEPRARQSLEESCLMCGGIGRWSSHYANAVYVPPPGHRMEYVMGSAGVALIVIDSCGNHIVT